MSLPRPLVIGVTALLALGAAATGAAAQATPVDVTASANAGSRQFFVEDLAGAALTKLELGTSGQGQPFQTRVKDDNFTSTNARFTASAEMTNLYKTGPTGTLDYATKVASEKLSVDFAGVPTDVSGVSLGAVPRISYAGLLPKCNELSGLLAGTGSSLLSGTGGLLDLVLGPLGLSSAAAPLCNALGGATATSPVPVQTVDGVLVALSEKVIEPALGVAAQLPLGVTGSTESGNFAVPSFLGPGVKDPGKGGIATTRKLLAGTPNGSLDLDTLVSPLIDGLPLVPAIPGGTGALTSVSAVVAALRNSATPAVGTVGTTLAGLSALEQTKILGGLDPLAGTPVATLANTVLQRISGTYRSFPRLTADLSGAPTGTYTGTMTVTFVQN